MSNYQDALMILARKILQQERDCTGVMLSPTTAWLVKGDRTTRYLLSIETRQRIARFVEGGDFELGAYTLVPPRGAPFERNDALLVTLRRADEERPR